jgi:hypothetical protein
VFVINARRHTEQALDFAEKAAAAALHGCDAALAARAAAADDCTRTAPDDARERRTQRSEEKRLFQSITANMGINATDTRVRQGGELCNNERHKSNLLKKKYRKGRKN